MKKNKVVFKKINHMLFKKKFRYFWIPPYWWETFTHDGNGTKRQKFNSMLIDGEGQ